MLPAPEPPPGTRVLSSGPTTAWVREGYEPLFSDGTLLRPDGFSAAGARAGALPGGRPFDSGRFATLAQGRGGRGEVVALDLPGRPGERAVWRHYRRGGWLGPLLGDLFRDPWRPFREYTLAERLRAAGVLTPVPLAALSHRATLGWHRGDLLTREEPGTEDVAAFCRRTASLPPRDRARERRAAARALATVLSRMHEAGLYHRDLHVGNLLLRAGAGGPVGPMGMDALVLDLDKSRPPSAPLGDAARARNLLRLFRSAEKARLAGVPVGPRDAVRVGRAYARLRPGVGERLRRRSAPLAFLAHALLWRAAPDRTVRPQSPPRA